MAFHSKRHSSNIYQPSCGKYGTLVVLNLNVSNNAETCIMHVFKFKPHNNLKLNNMNIQVTAVGLCRALWHHRIPWIQAPSHCIPLPSPSPLIRTLPTWIVLPHAILGYHMVPIPFVFSMAAQRAALVPWVAWKGSVRMRALQQLYNLAWVRFSYRAIVVYIRLWYANCNGCVV